MKNVHLLSTDKPSRLFNCFGKLEIGDYTTIRENLQVTNQHIYITSDEEIKGVKWIIHNGKIYEVIENKELYISVKELNHIDIRKDLCKKIILTTDQDLIKDGVQAIDDDFLEWFVKNPSCEEVETYSLGIKNEETGESCHYEYEIIIPKEETIEEAAESGITEEALKFAKKISYPFEEWGQAHLVEDGVLTGIAWQAERMYSEALEFGRWIIQNPDFQNTSSWSLETAKFNFEQFKKKA